MVALGNTGVTSTTTPSNNALSLSDKNKKAKVVPSAKMEQTFDGNDTLDNLDFMIQNKLKKEKD